MDIILVIILWIEIYPVDRNSSQGVDVVWEGGETGHCYRYHLWKLFNIFVLYLL